MNRRTATSVASKTPRKPRAKSQEPEGKSKYVYAIIECGEPRTFGNIGIGGRGASEKGAITHALGQHFERQKANTTRSRTRGKRLQKKLDALTVELDDKVKEIGDLKTQLLSQPPIPGTPPTG